jgi:hypothetical protein
LSQQTLKEEHAFWNDISSPEAAFNKVSSSPELAASKEFLKRLSEACNQDYGEKK